jgi:Flp pilus assembly protein TadD
MNPKPISQAKDPDLRNAHAAMSRAAKVAERIAIQTNTALVVVQNGQLREISASELRSQQQS